MATPFLEFANCRMNYQRRTSRIPNFREGGRVPEETVVVECFASLVFSAAQGYQQAGAQELKQQFLKGYICRYAVIPAGTNWLDPGTNWSWNESGLKPDGLQSGNKVRTWFGKLQNLPNIEHSEQGWTDLRSVILAHGVGGIGDIIRSVAGDRIDGIYTFTG